MRKSIIFVSILAGFLLLMMPNVNSIEYNQINSDKINTIEKINRLSEQVKEKYVNLLNKPVKNEKVYNVLSEIACILEGICFSCAECGDNPWDPRCPELFYQWIAWVFVGLICLISIILAPMAAYLWFFVCVNIYNEAHNLGCLWASIRIMPN